MGPGHFPFCIAYFSPFQVLGDPVGGSILAGQWALDYILALFFGIFFQYAAIPVSYTHLDVYKRQQL